MPPVIQKPQKTPANEVLALRQALLDAEQRHATETAAFHQKLDAKDQQIIHLHERIHLLLVQRFGCRADTVPSPQLGLFDEAEVLSVEADEPAPQTTTVASHTRVKKGRRPLPENLPRVEVIHDISDKTCPHDGAQLKAIGEDVSEQLDIVPATVQVIRHIRKKYACPCCESHLVTAAKPPQMIEKSNASAGFLAWMVQGKYQLAMPLYRQSQYLSALHLDIPRGTLATWTIRCGHGVQPVINRLREMINTGAVQQVDETTIQVLKEKDRRPQSKSQIWVQRGGPPGTPIVLFHYAASRSQSVLEDLIHPQFAGAIQSDGYAGYDRFVALRAASTQPSLVHLGCLAHARRKFVEAAKAQKKKTGAAHMAIALIAKLYAIEAKIKNQAPEDKARIRQAEARPILQQIRVWLDKHLGTITPSSLTGKAIAYLQGQWPKLTRYVDNGLYEIDNNGVERAIRPFTIGRKNWMFSDTPAGATASANLYSLVETAKVNGIEPYTYLKYLFTALPKATTGDDMDALLPIAENRERFLQIA